MVLVDPAPSAAANLKSTARLQIMKQAGSEAGQFWPARMMWSAGQPFSTGLRWAYFTQPFFPLLAPLVTLP